MFPQRMTTLHESKSNDINGKKLQFNHVLTAKLIDWHIENSNKKLSYCWETVRRESMPRIAEMDVEMTT